MMTQWEELADEQTIEKTIKSLGERGIEALVVGDGKEAKKEVLAMIPEGAEVMTMSSTTLDTMGLAEEINKPGSKFKSVRARLAQMKQLGSVPEVAVGSVQAVTEEGQALMASNTGSQSRKAYGMGSNVSKLLIINKEIRPGRVRLILVRENLGF